MEPQLQREHTELRDYWRPIWRRRWLILVVVAVVTAGTYAHYAVKPKLYESTTSLFFGSSETDQLLAVGSRVDERGIANQSVLLKTRTVATEAARRLRFKGDPRQLTGSIKTKPADDSDFIAISAIANNPTDAAALANAFAKAYVSTQTKELRDDASKALRVARRELAMIQSEPGQEAARADLIARIRRLESIAALPRSSVRQIDEATVPSKPFAPNPNRNTIFAFLLSIMFGVGLALLLERLDRRIRTVEDVQSGFGQPLLADVTHAGKAAPVLNGKVALSNPLRESFRSLRTNLQLASLDREMRTVLVTSALPGEGKTTVVTNLALAYREAGVKVCAVDADLRRAGLAQAFGVEREPGLTNVLTGGTTLDDGLQLVDVHVPGLETLVKLRVSAHSNGRPPWDDKDQDPGALAVLTSGPEPANPPAVLAAERMQETLNALSERFDVVLIDSPPLLAVSDAVPLLSNVDGVVLVARVGTTTTVAARRTTEILLRIPHANVLGVVANDIEVGALEGRLYQQHMYGPYGDAVKH